MPLRFAAPKGVIMNALADAFATQSSFGGSIRKLHFFSNMEHSLICRARARDSKD